VATPMMMAVKKKKKKKKKKRKTTNTPETLVPGTARPLFSRSLWRQGARLLCQYVELCKNKILKKAEKGPRGRAARGH
jgi:hypothetical protein